jgi:hypothetical protein
LNGEKKIKGTIHLDNISVYKTGNMASIEQEIQTLAPLLFYEYGLPVVVSEEKADYSADIQVHEREYQKDWKTRRSISLEVRILNEKGLPVAVGQIIPKGITLSDAKDLKRVLKRGIARASRALKVKKGADFSGAVDG